MTEQQIEQLQAAGAEAYVTKPVDVNQLLEIVDGILKDASQ